MGKSQQAALAAKLEDLERCANRSRRRLSGMVSKAAIGSEELLALRSRCEGLGAKRMTVGAVTTPAAVQSNSCSQANSTLPALLQIREEIKHLRAKCTTTVSRSRLDQNSNVP